MSFHCDTSERFGSTFSLLISVEICDSMPLIIRNVGGERQFDRQKDANEGPPVLLFLPQYFRTTIAAVMWSLWLPSDKRFLALSHAFLAAPSIGITNGLRYPRAHAILRMGSKHPNIIPKIHILPSCGSRGSLASMHPREVSCSDLSSAPNRFSAMMPFLTANGFGGSGARAKNSLMDMPFRQEFQTV